MMKMFRWSGFISFLVFTALLVVVGFFFIDGWMKKAIESAGYSINGAEVNVANVDLTLSPIGFIIKQVEISDADKPTHNALELGELRLDINFPQLFLGNVRINDITIADVKSNTLRKKPAKVAPLKPATANAENKLVTDAKEKAATLAKQFPEPKDILTEQTENTRNAVAVAESTIESAKENVTVAVKDLPGDAELASYKKRIAEIKAIELDSLENFQKSQRLVTGITADIAKDKIAIETVKLKVNGAVKDSKKAVENILGAPAKDWAQLKADYPLNKDSAMKIAQILLGDAFFERIDKTKYWYNKAKPWLARLKSDEEEKVKPPRLRGEFVRFPHPDPTATFQLDKALLSFVSDDWPWQLTINDVSSKNGNKQKPVTMQMRRGKEGSEALLVNGVLAQVDGKSVDTFTLQGKGIDFAAQSVNLAGTQLNWVPDNADVAGKIVSTAGQLEGKVTLLFPKNKFTAEGKGAATKYIATAVQKVEHFEVDLLVSGTVKKPKFTINSDLDNQLSAALGDVAKAEYEAWLKDVREKIDAEVARLRAPVDAKLASLEQRRDDIEKKIKQFEQEVEAEVRSLEAKVAAEKKRLEELAKAELDAAKQKVQAELDAAKAKADAEKQAAEDAAKKAAEQKLKEEADKLKGKIKF